MTERSHWKKYSGKTHDDHREICRYDMVDIAHEHGTPLFVLFEEIIIDNYSSYKQALDTEYTKNIICYAVKANTSLAVLELLAQLGGGADVASEYELRLALTAGIKPEKIRANGNCKSNSYLEECIRKGIIINVDPEEELQVIEEISMKLGINATINLRLSGFPLSHITSNAIITSGDWSKFGISIARIGQVLQKVKDSKWLNMNGLMVHLGSQITDIKAYFTVLDIMINLAKDAQNIGLGIHEIDMGGGWGIKYFESGEWESIKLKIRNTQQENYTWADEMIGFKPDLQNNEYEWVGEELYCPSTQDVFIRELLNNKHSNKMTFKEKLEELGSPRFVIEPGRSLIGNAGITIAKIGRVSRTPLGHNMIHLDMGVNCNTFGTAVPEQLHRIEIANNIKVQEPFETFVAGNLCFTGDLFCRIKIL